MAPGTNAGAAHPVAGEGQDLPKTLSEKAEQDARAFIRSIARQRGRNAEKAEAAVSSSLSYTETEAKEGNLIDLVARDVPDLVAQLDGRVVRRLGGKETTLRLKGFETSDRQMSGVEKLLGVVSHPNVAYLLFLLGLVGLYFELSSPGAVLPGDRRRDRASPRPVRLFGPAGQPGGARADPLRDPPLRGGGQGGEPWPSRRRGRRRARRRVASALLRAGQRRKATGWISRSSCRASR